MKTKLKVKEVVAFLAVLILLVGSIYQLSYGQTNTKGVKRSGIKATSLITQFEYDESISSAIGIPSGAKVYRSRDHETVGDPVLVASEASLVDESINDEEMRLIRVKLSLRNLDGKQIANIVAWFRPFGDNAYIVKTVLESQYESIYKWVDIPGYSLVNVTTTDLKTGRKVHETKDLEIIKDKQGEPQGLFTGLEYYYTDGKTTCISQFIRHAGTGLLVDERITGVLPQDYHTYEFVLSGWPSGSRF